VPVASTTAQPTHPNLINVGAKSDIVEPSAGVDLSVSARTGAGLRDLEREIVRRCHALLPTAGEVALSRRHRMALHEVKSLLDEARSSGDPIIRAELLRSARQSLDAVTGRAGVEDMFDRLFERFCIGK
jgi:tRNA modification GTPase